MKDFIPQQGHILSWKKKNMGLLVWMADLNMFAS